MKRATLAMTVSIGWALVCSAAAGSWAQGPAQPPDLGASLAMPDETYAAELQPSPFEPWRPSPHFSIGCTDLWSEYRGAAIEHIPRAAREEQAGHYRRRPLLSLLARWLDTIFAPLAAPRKNAVCLHCSQPLPSRAPADAYDAPDGEHVAPLQPIPAVPEPALPEIRPAPVPPLAPGSEAQPSAPQRLPHGLGPDYPPVVELAPEPVIPSQPPRGLPPRNVVPAPPRPPRNQLPR
jgi:hypothetical protein